MNVKQQVKKVILASVAMMTLGASATVIAHASADVWVGGGRWRYGVGKKYVWSYYDHKYRNHSSAVKGRYEANSGLTAPGLDAKASAEAAKHGNKTYYNYW